MEYLDTATVPLSDLRRYPGNARLGAVDTVVESIQANGQYRSLVVRVEDDGQQTILAGNNTAEALTRLGIGEVRIERIRCADDEEAARINLVDNKSNDRAAYDDEKLLAQLRELDDLRGTGFVVAEIDDLAALLEEQGRADLARLADSLGQSGMRDTVSIGDYAERYGSKATRVLIAEYHNDVYAWIVDRLAELREEWGLTSNAEAIRRLLEEKSGREAPTPDGSG